MPDTSSETVGGTELAAFLRARRGRVSPEDAGLVAGPGIRRTPGLRREELATLAGISIDYYIRLERGRETNPSPSVIDSLARALQLDPTEHEHLRLLAWHSTQTRAASRVPARRPVNPAMLQMLESLRPLPATISSRTGDLLAWNPSGLRLMLGLEKYPADKRNGSRFVFLDPAARILYPDWENQLAGAVAHLRSLAGKDPEAEDLAQLVGELLVKSSEFANLWNRYDVKAHITGSKTFLHPEVGQLKVSYQTMQLDETGGQAMIVFSAPTGSPEYDALVLLDRLGVEAEANTAGGVRRHV